MKLNRRDILHKLLCIEPGVSKRETIQQSSCVVITNGRFYSQSLEISCSIPSGLPKELTGVVKADKLIDLLKLMVDEEIDFNMEGGVLKINGHKKRVKLAMEVDILLPIHAVELPKTYVKLHDDFTPAVDMTHRCTTKKKGSEDSFTKSCVHITKTYLEGCDNVRMARYLSPTFVQENCLVKGEAIKAIIQLGMTQAAETERWLHFRNPLGLRVSVCKFAVQNYPQFDEFLNLRGRKLIFPKCVAETAKAAGLFAEEEGIRIRVSNNEIFVSSANVEGEFEEPVDVKYTGPNISFSMPPKLLTELVEKHNEVEVTTGSLTVRSSKFTYATTLEA